MAQLPADSIDEGNELVGRISEGIERLRPHRGTILACLAGLTIAAAAWSLVSSQMAASRAQSWDAYLAALSTGNPAGFQDVIARHPESEAANWSRLVLAEMALREGAELAFSDRSRSKGRLEAASQLYGMVLAAKPQGLLAERAVFGLAKAREGLGMIDEARQGYETIAREYPFGGLATLAADHAASLGRDATRRWYDWFAAQDVAAAKAAAVNESDTAKSETATSETKEAATKEADGAVPQSPASAEAPAASKPADDKQPAEQPAK